jgi:uncharacterized membrane protein
VLAGADLIRRGVTGHCYFYQVLGVATAAHKNGNAAIPYRLGIRVDEAVTIHRTPQDLYSFWRNFENLPRFMKHLLSVSSHGNRSRWVAQAPGDMQVEWEAEIISDVPNEMISWRSLPGSQIDTAGSVHFIAAPGDRGTEVKVELQYRPPGGILSALVARLFGEEPAQQVREDLRHFKQLMEAGELPTTEGQPQGAGDDSTFQLFGRERRGPGRVSEAPQHPALSDEAMTG